MEGKSNYKPTRGMEESMHVIGEGHRPVYICKKGEVPKLFDDNFYYLFHLWQFFNYGLQPPGGGTWDSLHPDVLNCMTSMQNHYDNNFSIHVNIMRGIENLNRNIVTFLNSLAKRRR